MNLKSTDAEISWFFCIRLLNLVESGIIKYKLREGLPNAEICPQNLAGTERQLRNGDLLTTYLVMLTGFCTASVVFFTEARKERNTFKKQLRFLFFFLSSFSGT
jgi:hypothetical protein